MPALKYTRLMVAALTVACQVQAAEQTYLFDIPAQDLATALQTLAAQSGVQILYAHDTVSGHRSSAFKSKSTLNEALIKLLTGSGLQFSVAKDGSVAIKPDEIPQNNATQLPKVTVVGNNIYDIKDPYNEDYALPNATAGTKTDTPIMETPLNIQVISKQVLKDQQVITLADSLKNVSGVTTGSSYSGNGGITGGGIVQPITLRGFASNVFMRNGFRFQDGAAIREMANVENVEVLKGSAAILYGQVEPGGIVNIITKQPLAKPYYALQQQVGSFNMYRTTLDATGPLTQDDTLLYRMNMSYENSGSFREFVNNEKVYIAPVLKWNISSKTQATFELEYSHQSLGMDAQFMPTYNGQFTNIPRSRNYGEPSTGLVDSVFGGVNWSHQFNDDWGIKHSFAINKYRADRLSVVPFTPQYGQFVNDFSTNLIDRTLYQRNSDDGTYLTNIDLTGHFDTAGLKHTLLVGGDYYRYHSTQVSNSDDFFTDGTKDSWIDPLNPVHPGLTWNGVSYVPIPSGAILAGQSLDPNLQFNYKWKQHTDQYGIYLQDQIKLPYDFHFTGGFRYQQIHQKGSYQSPLASTPNAVMSQDAVTPRFGLLWQPQRWLSVYSNYTENFGPNSGIIWPTKAPVPATGAQQWEVGAKTEFFDGRFRATVAYYDLTKTNVSTSDPVHNGFNLVVGGVRSRGPELDIQGEILPGWNLIATYSNTDIIVTKGTDNANDYPVVGNRYYGVPRNTGSIWNTFEFQDETLRGIKLGGGVTLRDGQLAYTSTNTAPASLSSIPGYATFDLLAAYSQKIGKTKVTAQLNVNNLLDKYYLTSALFAGGATPVTQGFDGAYVNFGAPRTLMGSIRVEY